MALGIRLALAGAMDDPRSDNPIVEPDDFMAGDAWPDFEGAAPRATGLDDDAAMAADDSLRWFYGGTEPPEQPAAERLRRAA